MATETWPWAYWPGLAGVYGGILLLAYHVSSEEAFQGLSLGTRIAIGIVAFCLVYIWSANTVFVKLPIDIRAIVDKGNYPQGTDVAGIKWNPFYSDVRLLLSNPTGHDYSDIDLAVATDEQIVQVGQVTDIPNVSFFPQTSPPVITLGGADGQDLPVIPIKGTMQSCPIYRIRIEKLPRHSTIQIAVATVRMNAFVPGKGMPDSLFAPKTMPKWLSVKGNYRAFARERELNETRAF